MVTPHVSTITVLKTRPHLDNLLTQYPTHDGTDRAELRAAVSKRGEARLCVSEVANGGAHHVTHWTISSGMRSLDTPYLEATSSRSFRRRSESPVADWWAGSRPSVSLNACRATGRRGRERLDKVLQWYCTHSLCIVKNVAGVRLKYLAGFLPQSTERASCNEQNCWV